MTDNARPAPIDEDRYKTLAEELRCLVCQNQSLADSHADLAGDLRDEVREQMAKGQSDDEIKAFLVARYGDFVLFRPPLKETTWPLWAGPFGLLAAGAGAWWLVQRRQRLGRGADAGAAPRRTGEPGDAKATGEAAEAGRAKARRLLD